MLLCVGVMSVSLYSSGMKFIPKRLSVGGGGGGGGDYLCTSVVELLGHVLLL